MQKKQTKRAAATSNGMGELRLIPLSEIEPSDNIRQSSDKKKYAELLQSVKDQGVLQPILLRPVETPTKGAAKFRLVAGARRVRAATEAGLAEIPAYVKMMSDAEALSAQLVENLLREDVHPLDEADGYRRLKEELKLDVRGIAQRVAKDPRYVARRLPLTSLIEEAREDFRQEHLALGHVLEICRLAPEIQTQALAACYHSMSVRTKDGYEYAPDKTQPAQPVGFLQQWLEKNVHLNLQSAPFELDDPRLREDGLTCLVCPQRTGRDKLLFADIKNGDTCLNRVCYSAKYRQWLGLIKAEVEQKQGKPAAFISAYSGWKATDKGPLSQDQYQLLEKKADRCEFAEQAIYSDGVDVGKVKWICREKTCKDHLGRVPDTPPAPSASVASTAAGPAPAERQARKQELFDLRVDEAVRTRVMAEALKTFAWPLERKHLNEAVKEFFRRIPTDDQRTICEVFGWSKEEAAKLHFSGETVLRELAKLDDNRLAQFLMLCSFAHYGANRDKQHQVDQSAVLRLSQACGVNHKLIDAEVRAQLCPKKYKDAHLTYLEAVKGGKRAQKPVVCEQSSEAAPAAE